MQHKKNNSSIANVLNEEIKVQIEFYINESIRAVLIQNDIIVKERMKTNLLITP